MTIQDIVEKLSLKILNEGKNLDTIIPSGGYASDLLSCVMAGAKHGYVWVTLQAHLNIIAVAALLDLSAIIITEGAKPDSTTLAKAQEQSVTLLWTEMTTYETIGKLWDLGITASK
jgi:serine kinase of HPr protein (carbohydrate metabolism regulator)